jgi:WD40 repeat protein
MSDRMGITMKDERAHLQLFDLIARDWMLASPATGITFNNANSAVAFSCADGTVYLAATADKEPPNSRIRRAVDTARLTIAPRSGSFAPLKAADFTDGRSSAVVPHGPTNFAFAKIDGRINTLTPGGIAVHLPVRATGPIEALSIAPDGQTVAYLRGGGALVCTRDGDLVRSLSTPAPATAISFSPDGKTLAVADELGVSLWAADSLDRQAVHTPIAGTPDGLFWRADAAWLAIYLREDGFGVMNVETRGVTTSHNFPSPVHSLGFGGPTDAIVAAGAFRVVAWGLENGTDFLSGKAGLVIINAVATCPTRNLVAVGYANGLISLAEVGRPSEILLREDTGAAIQALAWSTDGNYLAVAGADGSVALVEFPDSMFKS